MAEQPGRGRRHDRLTGGDLVCLVLFLAGIAAMFQLERGGQLPLAQPDLRAWRAEASDGTPIVPAPGAPSGVRLPAGSRFWLIDEHHELNRYHEIAFELQPHEEPAHVDVLLRWTRGTGYRARLQLLPRASGMLWFDDGRGGLRRLAEGRADEPAERGTGDTLRLVIALEGDRITVTADGTVLFEHEGAEARDGWIELRPTRGDVTLLALDASGRSTSQTGKLVPFEVRDAMRAESPPSERARALADGAGTMTAAWVAAALFLGALRRRPAGLPTTLLAGLRLLAPACLVLLAGVLLRLPSTTTLAAAAAPLGMPFAWRRVHAAGGSSDPRPPRASLALATVLLLCGGTIWAVGRHEHTVLGQAAEREQAARSAGSPAPFRSDAPVELRADNALVVPGPWSDARLRARVTLAEDGVLAVRLRAPRASIAEGVVALLPGDPQLRAGTYHEDPLYLWELCPSAPPLPAGRELSLEILMQGRHVRVSVDGERLMQAESLQPAGGHIVVLSNRGRVTLHELTVEAVEPPPAASTLVAAGRAALTPVAVLVAFALVASWLLPFGVLGALQAAAFALLPLLSLLLLTLGDASPSADRIGAVAVAGGVVLALVPLTRWRARPLAALLLAAASGAALAPAIEASVRSTPQVTADLMSRMSYMDWPGERLHEGLLHAEHPLFRRWNHYLARHTFRERVVSLEKPPRTTRVVTLGGSSTWGWRVPADARADWPAALGDLLNRRGEAGAPGGSERFEVINAAYVGTTSGRLFRMLRNVLVEYEPDIVVLCVFYNDSPALSQGDEEAYLARVTAPGYRRGWLDDWWEQRRREGERANLQAFMRGGLRRDDAAAAWRASGAAGWPPDRFAASLRRHAELAREHGIRLVLVKEPIAGDGPFLWKQEFYAEMDALGREFDLPVVDPSPALQAAGGRKLFMDDVHLKPAGHRVVAEVLAPVLRALSATAEADDDDR